MIEISRLQKVVGQDAVLEVDALRVAGGEAVAVLGPRSGGRAYLLALLLGRETPTAGHVRVLGADPVSGHALLKRHLGVLLAENGLYERQSALANLTFFCRLYDLPKERALETLAEVGLADRGATRAAQLPEGLARRLALGRAILHRPRALVLEDPFVGCDEASVAVIRRVIEGQAAGGAAVLILAEGPLHLADLCDRFYALSRGLLSALPDEAPAESAQIPFKVPVRAEDKIVLVNPAEILYAVARESRTYLQTSEALLPSQFTLTELEERLSRSGFFRAHRAYLVNLQHVREVIPYTRDSFTLRLDDPAGTQIPLSKSAAADLRALLGY